MEIMGNIAYTTTVGVSNTIHLRAYAWNWKNIVKKQNIQKTQNLKQETFLFRFTSKLYVDWK
jgi:hypothetical protein